MKDSQNKNEKLKDLVKKAYEDKVFCQDHDKQVWQAVADVIDLMESGDLRVCTKGPEGWVTHQWLKKAILLYFKMSVTGTSSAGWMSYRDKVFPRRWDYEEPQDGIRVVPPAAVRKGAYIAPGVILMPSFVNVGAFVGRSTMVDTWATVGSCSQIGECVHLSGGVGIGGVLEPLQASPVIIEDHVFVGSRCVIVEGAYVEEGAVLGAGVVITASTPIIDVTTSSPQTFKKRVPKNSVVIPGMRPKDFPGGTYHIPCALIIGKRSESTDKKTSLTEALRQHSIKP